MLLNLQVRDFAIVDRIELEFDRGMTVLTGETGAGKSILIDALALVLGERGGAQLVRQGAQRAEFAAEFDISALPQVASWLTDNELDQDGDCLLRRVVGANGRSRAFINGVAVPVSHLKQLGEYLLDIHGQHFHQSLGRKQVQRELLDHYGGHRELCASVAAAHASWSAIRTTLDKLLNADADRSARIDLLTFQVQELRTLAIREGEPAALSAERSRLMHSGRIAENLSSSLNGLMDNEASNANSLIADAVRALEAVVDVDESLAEISEQLQSAGIQVAEVADSLRRYADTVDMDPNRRNEVEERLDAIQALARKHRRDADELISLELSLSDELDTLLNSEQRGEELQQELEAARERFDKLARQLSKARQTAGTAFAAAVTDAMQGLGMPGGTFATSVVASEPEHGRASGIDDIEFLISANPGQVPQGIAKVASGGELSRMSLSIQVIASDGSDIPTMIFDEVDSGVGGGVAEMVGRRLQELSGSHQVLCVTHLPQVASLADQHVRISKVSDGASTRTSASKLTHEERVDEIARMLGGVEITRTTREHAAEMLAAAERKSA